MTDTATNDKNTITVVTINNLNDNVIKLLFCCHLLIININKSQPLLL